MPETENFSKGFENIDESDFEFQNVMFDSNLECVLEPRGRCLGLDETQILRSKLVDKEIESSLLQEKIRAEGASGNEVARKEDIIETQKCEIEELSNQNLSAEEKIHGLRDEVEIGQRQIDTLRMEVGVWQDNFRELQEIAQKKSEDLR
jgi:FtsZ-binding cell division protein ZapB